MGSPFVLVVVKSQQIIPTSSRAALQCAHKYRRYRAFPDGRSALMLVAARLRHIAGTRWGTKRYLDMGRLREQEQIPLETAAEEVA